MSETPLALTGFQSGPSQALSSPSRCFLLECLPLELHQKIYSYIYTPWSLAIFDADDDHELDETVTLVKVGIFALSGPPGHGLLLACRDLYSLVKPYYGREFTGKIYTGQILRLATVAEHLPRAFRKWYCKTRSLSSICPQSDSALVTYFTRVFRNVRTFDCIIHNRMPGPLLQHPGVLRVLDNNMTRWSHYIAIQVVNHFYNNHPCLRWHDKHERPCPADAYTLNLKVIAWDITGSTTPIVAGVHIRYEGRKGISVAQIARTGRILSYWEEGMDGTEREVMHVETEDDVPERMRWVAQPRGYHSELVSKGI